MPDVSQLLDPWATIRPYLPTRPSWVKGEDADRIASYWLYEMMYWGVPNAFKLIQRGSESKPIYIASGKQIVETMHRYVAPRLSIIPDPNLGSSAEQTAAQIIATSLFRRENFYATFSAAKRFGIMRGDWVFHLMADPDREPGSRISLVDVDPSTYFPIFSDDDVNVQIGVDLAEPIKDADGKDFVYKLTYMKETLTGGPSPILVSEAIYEPDKSGLPGVDQGVPTAVIQKDVPLDPLVTQLPVYHISNFTDDGTHWGSSEMRGLERMIGAVNQGITDEELTLAMEGLGVYATDAGTPVDETSGEPTTWNLGPARVIELPSGKKFERVSGVQSIEPYQAHLAYLHSQLDAAASTPAVAKGTVDVQMAESGIALALHLAPILSKGEEKELEITGKLQHLLYDLGVMWLPAYEQVNIGAAQLIPAYGDRIPVNRKERFDELLAMLGAGNLVSLSWVRGEMKKIGYDFPTDQAMMNQIIEEKQVFAQLQTDIISARLQAELDAGGGQPQPTPPVPATLN